MEEENVEEFLSDPIMKKIEEKFVAAIEKLEKNGPTSQLWLLYFNLICLVLRYIDSERSGNFDLHLEIVLLMIPIFFASGHHLYAKACLLYVQQMLKLREMMELFCNITFASSEQHVDNRVSRISRDASDLAKVLQFFATHDPFPETDHKMGIYTDVVGDLATVNCHKAYEIGKALMDATSSKKSTDVKYKRSSKVVHLAAANSTIKNAANEEVYISPLLIFQKICLNIENKDDM